MVPVAAARASSNGSRAMSQERQPEASARDRHHALQLAVLPRQRKRLVERLAASRVASPRAQEAQRVSAARRNSAEEPG